MNEMYMGLHGVDLHLAMDLYLITFAYILGTGCAELYNFVCSVFVYRLYDYWQVGLIYIDTTHGPF